MGLETGNRIEDLVDSNPTPTDPRNEGDDHLRLIKTCLQGSFPSLGSSQVTVTAAELNVLSGATSHVDSFNGRTGVVVPAANDYAIDELSDVDTTTTAPVTGNLLRWDGSDWVPGGARSANMRLRGISGTRPTNKAKGVAFSNTDTNDESDVLELTGTLAVEGVAFTALRDCSVTATFILPDITTDNNGQWAWVVDGSVAADPSAQSTADVWAYVGVPNTSGDPLTLTCNVKLTTGQELWLNAEDIDASPVSANAQARVTVIATEVT